MHILRPSTYCFRNVFRNKMQAFVFTTCSQHVLNKRRINPPACTVSLLPATAELKISSLLSTGQIPAQPSKIF